MGQVTIVICFVLSLLFMFHLIFFFCVLGVVYLFTSGVGLCVFDTDKNQFIPIKSRVFTPIQKRKIHINLHDIILKTIYRPSNCYCYGYY